MGFDLTSESGAYLRFSPSGWALALNLAGHYGWLPEGTTLRQSESGAESTEWSGEYATNDGQRVSASDANALAGACERALADAEYAEVVSDTLRRISEAVAAQVPDRTAERVVDPDVAQKFRGRLEELIAFCRSGSFIIE
ncbi:MAG TPA: hypothetical protein VFE47_12670 [Tepidisphaeraceae bacterium]|jgi:hypothetical protein|nr:hypothetical protein [Tepidisphaeraceae bacterium]